ncbi:hypothetical protein [Amycolatopsis sp. lyj-90]|uniref:hypothetical protein n=1 Tax=Amycolatopsis sp. lyj-90 TaxID=2789285 RepID=UPI00397D0179
MSTSPVQAPLTRDSTVPMYVAETTGAPATPGARNTVGGWPVLPAGEPWPLCFCGTRMILFFQFDIPADIAVFGGDHLLVFQCPTHNDAVVAKGAPDKLPPGFWDTPPPLYTAPGAFWRIMRHRDDTSPAPAPDEYLRPRQLDFRPASEEVKIWWPEDVLSDGQDLDSAFTDHGTGLREFKIGGVPSWIQGRESYTCPCGHNLVYVCQLPTDTGFDKHHDRPEQLDTFRFGQYGLFLGNETYVLACPSHCHPAAAWPVNQN